ncbi:MAG: DUF1289 domain-containing protein [Rubrivivax sp.]|nr:DUF1289 domain-containing protein [Rubrivivax sp.]
MTAKTGVVDAVPVREAPVPSPCVNVCRMDEASGLCEGCLRTIDEIAAWGQLDDEAKRAVWVRLEQRRAGHEVPAARRRAAP